VVQSTNNSAQKRSEKYTQRKNEFNEGSDDLKIFINTNPFNSPQKGKAIAHQIYLPYNDEYSESKMEKKSHQKPHSEDLTPSPESGRKSDRKRSNNASFGIIDLDNMQTDLMRPLHSSRFPEDRGDGSI